VYVGSRGTENLAELYKIIDAEALASILQSGRSRGQARPSCF